MGSRTAARGVLALALALLATALVGTPALATTGTRDCTGKGTILIEARTSQAIGASVTARAVGSPGSGSTWSRRLPPKSGIIAPARWAFVSPVVNGSWGASPINDGAFSGHSQCTKGATTSLPHRTTISLGSKTCPTGQHVMARADVAPAATGVLGWTSGSTTGHFVSASGQRITFNIVDTGRRSLSSASVKVYAKNTIPSGDKWVFGHGLSCSKGTTSGD
jgi:hypothetical protein